MRLSRDEFVGQFGISFGVHCLRRWPVRRKAAPTHLTTCFYESIRTNRGVISIGPADFAQVAQPVIEALHRTTPTGERPEWEIMATRLYDALDQAGVEITLKPFVMISAARQTEPKRGERGLIVRGAAGRRTMLEAKWGFPRPQKDRGGALLHHEPVNLIADLTNPMWSSMVPDPRYRCLIPVAAFAQPDGKRGSMTRAWFRVEDWPIFAWAGFCRSSEAWGPVYGAMTTDSNSAVAPLNPRMPVILAPDEYERWLEGSVEDVIEFQFRPPFPAEHTAIERTKELWVPRHRPRAPDSALL